MANNVIIKRSSVPGKVPVVGDLSLGELAINTYDGKVYSKKDNGAESIFEVTGVGSSGVSLATATALAISLGRR